MILSIWCDQPTWHAGLLLRSAQPRQRPSNEILNGLVRQYLSKGIDLSIYSQRDLDRIAHSLNTRLRAVLGFQTPEEIFMGKLSKLGDALQI